MGFRGADVPLRPPGPGSVEAAPVDAGLGGAITWTDLRTAPRDARGGPLLTRMRTRGSVLDTDVPAAFDAVLAVPTVTRDPSVPC